MTDSNFSINVRVGVCASYYTYCALFDRKGGSLLSRLPSRILNALGYFVLYTFIHRMGTDPFLKSVGLHRCGQVDWEKTTVRE